MQYDYIQRTYGASFYPGDKVEHTETGKCGEVKRPKPSHEHYVRVHFGDRLSLCHPRSLKIIARGEKWAKANRFTKEAPTDEHD